MSLIHCDPFAHYASADYGQLYTDGPSSAVVALGAYGPGGRPGFRFSGDRAYSVERLGVVTTGAICIAQFDFRLDTNPPATNIIFGCLLGASTHQFTLDINTDRTLAVYRGEGGTKTQLGSDSTYVVPLDTHIHIGVKGTIANSGGSIVVHVWEDGDTSARVVLNVTGVDTQDGATATWDGFTFGAGCNGNTDWANLIVMDGSGSSANDLLGPADVWALWANARETPALSAWALSAGSSVPDLVDDLSPDSDSTYVSETTQNDQFTVAVDTVPLPSRAILGAQFFGSVKLTSGSPTVRPIGYQSGTPNLGTTFSPAASYAYAVQPYSAMPDGTSFSDAATFDALQWGLKLTSTATGVRATQIVVAVIQARSAGRRNLVTGYTNSVTGDDNVATGQENTVIGGCSQVHGRRGRVAGVRSVLFSLDGLENEVTEDGVFEVCARVLGARFLELLSLYAPVVGNAALVKIDEQTPTGASATFSSLGAYTHLKVVATGRGDSASATIGALLFFNGDTAANYDRQQVGAANLTVSSSENLATNSQGMLVFPAATATSGLSGSGVIDIYDYRGTTFDKMATAVQTWKTANTSGNVNVRTTVLHWRNAAAITSLTIQASAGNFIAGTKFSLYGVV